MELRGFGHTFPEEVDVLLVAPGGCNAVVMSAAGGDLDVTNLTLTLDDEAAVALPNDGPLATGSYQPADYFPLDTFPPPAPTSGGNVALSTFDGIDPNGTWSLYVVDLGVGDSGSIANGWALTITAELSTPDPPAPNPAPNPDPAPIVGDGDGDGDGKGKKSCAKKGKGKGDGKRANGGKGKCGKGKGKGDEGRDNGPFDGRGKNGKRR